MIKGDEMTVRRELDWVGATLGTSVNLLQAEFWVRQPEKPGSYVLLYIFSTQQVERWEQDTTSRPSQEHPEVQDHLGNRY